MSYPLEYVIVSTYNREYVGLPKDSLTRRQASVPVILGGKDFEFTASKNILEGGPVKLSIGKFAYTGEQYGNVIASDDEGQSHDWYIFPHDQDKRLYYIGASLPTESDENPEVWNGEYTGGPIRLEPLSRGRPEQIFLISHLIGRK